MILDPAVAAARDPRSPEAIRQKRGVDARLVPVAASVWIAVGATMATRSKNVPLVCLLILAFAIGALVWNRRRRWRSTGVPAPHQLRRTEVIEFLCWQLIVCACVASASASLTALKLHHVDGHPWLSSESTIRFRGEVTIAGLPKLQDQGRVQVPVDLPGLGSVPLFVDANELPITASQQKRRPPLSTIFAPGQKIDVSATVRRSDKVSVVPLTLSAQRDVRLVAGGEPRGLWAMARHLRSSLLTQVEWLPDQSRMLVPGMVMGDVSMQPPDVRKKFTDTGLSHLSAVSGSNIAILASSIMIIATACGARRRAKTVIVAASLCAFVVVVGPEPSVLRATVMGLIGVIAVVTARWKDVVAAVCISIIVLLVIDPGLAANYGFVLSIVATVGISVLAPRWSAGILRWWARKTLARYQRPPRQWEAQLVRMVVVATAADAVTIPVIAHMTGKIPVVTIVANLLVLWAVPIITTAGMGLSVVGACTTAVGWGTGVTKWLAVVLVVPAQWVGWVATVLAGIPKITVPESWWGMAITGVVVVVVAWGLRSPERGGVRWAWAATIVALVMMCRVGTVGVEMPKRQWAPPRKVVVERGKALVVKDDTEAIALFGSKAGGATDDGKDASGASAGSASEERSRIGSVGEGAREEPVAVVVEECGKPLERPTFTASGIPVHYPCRNGTKVGK